MQLVVNANEWIQKKKNSGEKRTPQDVVANVSLKNVHTYTYM